MIDWNGNGKIDPVDVGISLSSMSCSESDFVELCGYKFKYIQELEPERNPMGKIMQFYPQESYRKKDSTPLNKYGTGPFCRFSLHSKDYWGVSGVYAIIDNKELLYIGQTENFQQRFNTGYGIIEPRNCYVGGQNTNCKINAMVLQKNLKGEQVFLFFFKTFDYDRVEHELIEALHPPYNGVWLPLSFSRRDTFSDTLKSEGKQDFETVWRRILENAGEVFYTGGRHLEFTYKAQGDGIVSSRARTTLLTKENFKNAYLYLYAFSPTEFSRKIMGSSYVKAILSDTRIKT